MGVFLDVRVKVKEERRNKPVATPVICMRSESKMCCGPIKPLPPRSLRCLQSPSPYLSDVDPDQILNAKG